MARTQKHKLNNLKLCKEISRGGGGLLSVMAFLGEALPERGTFLRLQVYKRVGI